MNTFKFTAKGLRGSSRLSRQFLKTDSAQVAIAKFNDAPSFDANTLFADLMRAYDTWQRAIDLPSIGLGVEAVEKRHHDAALKDLFGMLDVKMMLEDLQSQQNYAGSFTPICVQNHRDLSP